MGLTIVFRFQQCYYNNSAAIAQSDGGSNGSKHADVYFHVVRVADQENCSWANWSRRKNNSRSASCNGVYGICLYIDTLEPPYHLRFPLKNPPNVDTAILCLHFNIRSPRKFPNPQIQNASKRSNASNATHLKWQAQVRQYLFLRIFHH